MRRTPKSASPSGRGAGRTARCDVPACRNRRGRCPLRCDWCRRSASSPFVARRGRRSVARLQGGPGVHAARCRLWRAERGTGELAQWLSAAALGYQSRDHRSGHPVGSVYSISAVTCFFFVRPGSGRTIGDTATVMAPSAAYHWCHFPDISSRTAAQSGIEFSDPTGSEVAVLGAFDRATRLTASRSTAGSSGHDFVALLSPEVHDRLTRNCRPEGRQFVILGWRTSSELIATSNKALS